ncbi:MAG TPA: methylmalonyl-CoA epimerase [Longimicrobiales bacterium]|nr:methylmalonyl-CoA epimerase [Longimicrobiales bacterium]
MHPDPLRTAPPFVGLPLDHVAIAVASIDDVLPAFEALTGARGSPRERVESQGVELCFVGAGDGKLELLQPLAPDTPVGRFLARRGPGLHHVAYRVPDIARALRAAEEHGLEPIDRVPRAGAYGHKVAFLHPRSTGGVLVELIEP